MQIWLPDRIVFIRLKVSRKDNCNRDLMIFGSFWISSMHCCALSALGFEITRNVDCRDLKHKMLNNGREKRRAMMEQYQNVLFPVRHKPATFWLLAWSLSQMCYPRHSYKLKQNKIVNMWYPKRMVKKDWLHLLPRQE